MDAIALLTEVAFDVVITDGFSANPAAVFTTAQALREAAGATPVALFTAHKLELDAALAAGFAGLIEKPFDLERLEQSVRALLST